MKYIILLAAISLACTRVEKVKTKEDLKGIEVSADEIRASAERMMSGGLLKAALPELEKASASWVYSYGEKNACPEEQGCLQQVKVTKEGETIEEEWFFTNMKVIIKKNVK